MTITDHGKFYDNVRLPDYEQIVHCMHCGMCLPDCPTYALTGLEKHSPRGRIRMIKAVAEGELDITQGFIDSMDFCLDCQACVSACPAGVQYGKLVESTRQHIHEKQRREGKISAVRKLVLQSLFRKQKRLRLAANLLRFIQSAGLMRLAQSSGVLKLFSGKLHALSFLAPKLESYQSVQPNKDKAVTKPVRIGLLTGCVQDAFFSRVNLDTLDILERNGYEVVVPAQQNCCGSVHGHNGDLRTARTLAMELIGQFEKEKVDVVAVNAAGCGSWMKDYDDLFSDVPEFSERAAAFSKKVKDISEILTEFGWQAPQGRIENKVAYHEPCHLAHAQKVSEQPKTLLRSIPGLELVDLNEATWCCGSAGIYNITQYDASMELLNRKMENIKASGAEIVATGNPGCIIQLLHGTNRAGQNIRVVHPVTLMKESYQQEGAD